MEEPPKLENLIIKTESGNEGRTVINIYFGNKLKRTVEMKITKEFLQKLLSFIEKFFDTEIYTNGEGILFEDFKDQYKSFNLRLSPCDMEIFNSAYGTYYAEHRASVSLRYIRGPEAKRPSCIYVNSTKKQLIGELYRFIRQFDSELKSELIESLLEVDLYDYYDRIS
jgi:hypothetical protein